MKNFLIYCIICTILLAINFTPFANLFYGIDGIILSPVERSSYSLSQNINGFGNFLVSVREIYNQNTKLQEDNNSLIGYEEQVKQLKQENSNLKAQLGISNRPTQEYVLANITNIGGTGAVLDELKLDVGQKQGVKEGDMVIYKNFLIATINTVSEYSSKARLILSLNSSIPVKIGDNQIQGEVQGNLGNTLIINDIFSNENIKTGDIVLTSGIGGTYLPNLIVGQIDNVGAVKSAPSRTAYVKMLVDPLSLNQVFIIKD